MTQQQKLKSKVHLKSQCTTQNENKGTSCHISCKGCRCLLYSDLLYLP